MAFEEFGQLSKRRRAEDAEKLKKRVVIIVIVFVLVFLSVGGGILAYLHYKNQNESNNRHPGSGKPRGSSSEQMVREICGPTDYKVKCEDTIAKVSKSGSLEPTDIVRASISAAANEFASASNQMNTFAFDTPSDKVAYDDCKMLFKDAVEELQGSLRTSEQYNSGLVDDLRTWLSAVVSYQETCVDGFSDDSVMKPKMKAELNASKAYLSNALAMVANMPALVRKLTPRDQKPGRRLLEQDDYQDHRVGIPHWVARSRVERDLIQKSTEKLVPNVTVAKDGSGHFTTINQALVALPNARKGRFYIYIKEGIYNEYVIVTKMMTNITMYGDGSQKTVVTGNKNYMDKVPTFQTATFATIGEGFIAIGMGFKNTAGPDKRQAVALRVQADKSIFLNCRIEGYQDPLYAQAHRQFYRACVVIGTVDIIFGDAAAIFQDCTIQVRKPMANQDNTITAQARTCRFENTGFVLQSCRVVPDKDFEPDRHKFNTYLGRPWKDFSRTIVMESILEDLIHPQGWLKWEDKTAGPDRLKTLYYAEFSNRGPGADLKNRVQWPGYIKSLTKKQALGFTVIPFLQASWIKNVGVPVQLGLHN